MRCQQYHDGSTANSPQSRGLTRPLIVRYFHVEDQVNYYLLSIILMKLVLVGLCRTCSTQKRISAGSLKTFSSWFLVTGSEHTRWMSLRGLFYVLWWIHDCWAGRGLSNWLGLRVDMIANIASATHGPVFPCNIAGSSFYARSERLSSRLLWSTTVLDRPLRQLSPPRKETRQIVSLILSIP